MNTKMPRTSEKQKIINFLIEQAAFDILLQDDEARFWEIMENLNEELIITLSNYRGSFQQVPKSLEWRTTILPQLDEYRFQQMLRVTRDQFTFILSLIRNNIEFNKSHSVRQYSVDHQLAIVLFRLGSSGENAAIRKIASVFGVGDGETIYKITKRVFQAFLELKSKYIYWPDAAERQEIVKNTYNEMPHCIGYIDGTELKLAEAPVKNHTTYFSKSRIYSIKGQVVCDHQLKIRHVVVGHYGSVHDARMFRTSTLCTEEDNFFSFDQWLAGDSAYPLLKTIITPYRSNSQQLDYARRKAFNLRHSRFRVRIEHCFGLLKERFGSLKELRVRIQDEKSHNFCSTWFLVCCILHNILRTPSHDVDYMYNVLEDDEELDELTMNEIGQNSSQAESKRSYSCALMLGD
ncbi:protein ANTAGONIST OF LIKE HETEROCHROMATIN PROTEIN 1-like isoform X1 [Rhagoletis pomonella]|uniref:protein ANTAGONIST OF LIKE HETEROCHROMATIN PROTEIN 1-like isoform X1 n=1 Tax=Rhagoletis pomonella TaxID=28610 RepID=UPI00177E818F|nr:protein ANTAGONIST OF LIKE HETEROCHROMATIN PROTEIN 1-like isoform X1 [Rhagoletis pomonella]